MLPFLQLTADVGICRVLPLVEVSCCFERGTVTLVQGQSWLGAWQQNLLPRALRRAHQEVAVSWMPVLACRRKSTWSSRVQPGWLMNRDVEKGCDGVWGRERCSVAFFPDDFLLWFAWEAGAGCVYGLLRHSALIAACYSLEEMSYCWFSSSCSVTVDTACKF